MVTVKYSKICDLCAQAVEIEGFFLTTKQGHKVFCCAGCQSLYQLLDAHDMASTTDNNINNNEDNNS